MCGLTPARGLLLASRKRVLPIAPSCHCEPVTDVTGVAIRVQPGALHSAAGLRPAGSISVSPVLLFQIKACALIWRGRRKERICSFRGAYSNRGNGMQRVSSDVGGRGLPHQRARWFAMTLFEMVPLSSKNTSAEISAEVFWFT